MVRKVIGWTLVPVVAVAVISQAGCGGGTPSGPTARISPTPLPTPTPTPTPSPSPTQDPRTGLAPGPVITFTIGIRSIDTGGFNYRQPTQDAESGRWEVFPNEFIVIDGIARNGAGQRCTYVTDPRYFVHDPGGAVTMRGSSNPFLLRFDITGRGEFELSARIDDVESNLIRFIAKGNNQR